MRRLALLFLLSGAFGGVACDDSGGVTPPEPPGPVAEVLVIPKALVVESGGTGRLETRVQDAEGRVIENASVEWRSLDPTIAAVSDLGRVDAVEVGETVVEATVDGVVGEATVRVERIAGPAFQQIAAAALHTCGVTVGGQAYCWGFNLDGELGAGVTDDVCGVQNEPCSKTPVAVAGSHVFTEVSGGERHTCGVTIGGDVYCWGRGIDGQLGSGSRTGSDVPVRVQSEERFTQVSAGSFHTCALTVDSLAYCWGSGKVGALGTGTEESSLVPVRVIGEHRFSSISAAGFYTCGLSDSGGVLCWGNNTRGFLGVGGTSHRSEPTRVVGDRDYEEISRPKGAACAIAVDGSGLCWGSGFVGQIGDGNALDRTRPTEVEGGHRFQWISKGESHTCGVDVFGLAHCWGQTLYGILGNGRWDLCDGAGCVTRPTLVDETLGFESISAGAHHTCALTEAGSVYCWGLAHLGQLGTSGAIECDFPTGSLLCSPRPLRVTVSEGQ